METGTAVESKKVACSEWQAGGRQVFRRVVGVRRVVRGCADV